MTQALSLTVLELPRAFERGVHLAVQAERLGYSRYWVAEHFESTPGAIGSSIVAATVAASVTSTIRVGTAGILLTYYPVALAAVQFRAMAALFPGRIDAGFCRGITVNAESLEADVVDWVYPSKVQRLIRDSCGTDWPPEDGPSPSLWYLGSSPQSARLAAHFGLSYAYGLQFLANEDDPTAMTEYYEMFQPNERQSQPCSAVSVAGYCSDSSADIDRHISGRAWAAGYSPRVVGSPRECRDRLLDIAERYGVSELVFVNMTHDLSAKARSLELLADAMSLPRPELP